MVCSGIFNNPLLKTSLPVPFWADRLNLLWDWVSEVNLRLRPEVYSDKLHNLRRKQVVCSAKVANNPQEDSSAKLLSSLSKQAEDSSGNNLPRQQLAHCSARLSHRLEVSLEQLGHSPKPPREGYLVSNLSSKLLQLEDSSGLQILLACKLQLLRLGCLQIWASNHKLNNQCFHKLRLKMFSKTLSRWENSSLKK